jgi:photosystem II stability/assembly factor-like uncharacterized protein
MKHTFSIPAIVCTLLWPTVLLSQPAWHAQTSPVEEDLVTVSFASPSCGWAATRTGTVIQTLNGGKEWTIRYTKPDFYPEKLFFRDTLTGWMVGNTADSKHNGNALILRTENGGETWTQNMIIMGAKLYDLIFVNDTMGWAVGYYLEEGDTLGLRLHTTNTGYGWEHQQLGINVATVYSGVHFRDTDMGNICGPGPILLGTQSGGRTGFGWYLSILRISQPVFDLANAGAVYGCMVGAEGKIYFTKDNWVQFALDYNYPDGDTLWSVDAIDPPAFWIVGEAGTIIFVGVNTIFGAQVQDQSLDIPHNLYEIDALDNSLAWAVGESGTILHFGNEGGAGIQDPPPGTFSIFPNPATDHVMVTRQSEEAGWIKIYNLQGRLEQTIEARAGEVRIDVSLETLKTGQYIVQSGTHRKLLVVIR